ncbi:four-helix bundle copper-binding protein [Macrococcus carouselicus]|uniref:Four-helix bundle copper-binding protein n=1 Tax=Macrococcus carouselicus TaxID=69969 RepID=A0A9Q8CLC3_9STAP|nr:four-helix bundle copper-binding protein [Macrococcus carouselicus]TDM02533.1 four-helix bundle copper-binding protein [Macrococcus carouselicus]
MAACNHCFDACLNEEDVNMMKKCIRLDRECADICGYLEGALSRHSPVVKEIAEACAKICEACAEACRQHAHDHCQRCADACAKCAEACRQVA